MIFFALKVKRMKAFACYALVRVHLALRNLALRKSSLRNENFLNRVRSWLQSFFFLFASCSLLILDF